DEATVEITVHAVNDPPVAMDDAYEVDEDDTLSVETPGVLENDTDVDNEPEELTAVRVSGPSHGTLTLNADGSFVYQPDQDYFGADAFAYLVDDGEDESNEATVEITVRSINDSPVAVDDAYMVPRGQTVSANVLENDWDVDNEIAELTATLVDGPSNAPSEFEFNDDGSFIYTPADETVDGDSFTYNLSDGELDDTATVTLVFNDPPVANDDEVVVQNDLSATIDVLGNDSDPDGQLSATGISIESDVSDGTIEMVDGQIKYTPDSDFVGSDSFTYRVTDEHGTPSNVATVNIEVIADPTPWQNSVTSQDVNADKVISPLDALLVISHLNDDDAPNVSIPPTEDSAPPPYLDVSGDNFVSPIDALLVISYLNGESLSEGEDMSAASSRESVQPVSAAEGEANESLLASPLVGGSTSHEASRTDAARTVGHGLPSSVESPAVGDVLDGIRDEAAATKKTAAMSSPSAELDSLLDDIAEDVRGAQEEPLVDLALNELLDRKGNDF
ncbi:MAG: Ig-like domain-containing protein, partial [Planctomycetota bacterium]